jgi:hypothetical protein
MWFVSVPGGRCLCDIWVSLCASYFQWEARVDTEWNFIRLLGSWCPFAPALDSIPSGPNIPISLFTSSKRLGVPWNADLVMRAGQGVGEKPMVDNPVAATGSTAARRQGRSRMIRSTELLRLKITTILVSLYFLAPCQVLHPSYHRVQCTSEILQMPCY